MSLCLIVNNSINDLVYGSVDEGFSSMVFVLSFDGCPNIAMEFLPEGLDRIHPLHQNSIGITRAFTK